MNYESANESEARIMAESKLSVYVYCTVSYVENSSVIKIRSKVLRSSADLQLYDSEFQTEGALTLNAFADSASAIRGTVSNNLFDDRSVRAGR